MQQPFLHSGFLEESAKVANEIQEYIRSTFVDRNDPNSKLLSADLLRRSASLLKQAPRFMLTTLHLHHVVLLLHGGLYERVFDDIALPLTTIDERVQVVDILLLFYYLGLAQIRTSKYSDARFSMLTVISIPGDALSAICVAALRKLCLIELIDQGKLSPLPDWIIKRNGVTARIWDDMRKGSNRSDLVRSSLYEEADLSVAVYTDIVHAFTASDDPRELAGVIDLHSEYLRNVRDLGLARKVMLAKYHRLLDKACRIYSSIPVNVMMRQMQIRDPHALGDIIDSFNQQTSCTACFDDTHEYIIFMNQPFIQDGPDNIDRLRGLLEFLGKWDSNRLASIKKTKLPV